MTWVTQYGPIVWAIFATIWLFFVSRDHHKKGYLLALDHLEEMTRPKKIGKTYSLDEALKTLRDESK